MMLPQAQAGHESPTPFDSLAPGPGPGSFIDRD
jgi:hypothetical protein